MCVHVRVRGPPGSSALDLRAQRLLEVWPCCVRTRTCAAREGVLMQPTAPCCALTCPQFGQLGLTDIADRSLPTVVPKLMDHAVTLLACGWRHTMVRGRGRGGTGCSFLMLMPPPWDGLVSTDDDAHSWHSPIWGGRWGRAWEGGEGGSQERVKERGGLWFAASGLLTQALCQRFADTGLLPVAC